MNSTTERKNKVWTNATRTHESHLFESDIIISIEKEFEQFDDELCEWNLKRYLHDMRLGFDYGFDKRAGRRG